MFHNNREKIFKLLARKIFLSVSVRLLRNMYTSHVCPVCWSGVCSVTFSVLNEVKHGRVISPVLFASIWMNFLVNWLKQELAAISLVLLHIQMILCYWLLRLGLYDLRLVSVIIMRKNIRFCSMPKKIKMYFKWPMLKPFIS